MATADSIWNRISVEGRAPTAFGSSVTGTEEALVKKALAGLEKSYWGKQVLADEHLAGQLADHIREIMKTPHAFRAVGTTGLNEVETAIKAIGDTGLILTRNVNGTQVVGYHTTHLNTGTGSALAQVKAEREAVAKAYEAVAKSTAETNITHKVYEAFGKIGDVHTPTGASSPIRHTPATIVAELEAAAKAARVEANKAGSTAAQIAEASEKEAVHAAAKRLMGIAGTWTDAAHDVSGVAKDAFDAQVKGLRERLANAITGNKEAGERELKGFQKQAAAAVTKHNDLIDTLGVEKHFAKIDAAGYESAVKSASTATKGSTEAAKAGGLIETLLLDSKKVAEATARGEGRVIFGKGSQVSLVKALGWAAAATLGALWATSGKGEQQAHRGA